MGVLLFVHPLASCCFMCGCSIPFPSPVQLEFLFELPVRLNRSIELEAYAQAVKYYNMASGVLRKYDSVPSLHAIRVEADEIIGRLRKHLRSVLDTHHAGVPASLVVESIRLLVSLQEPRAALRDAYLSWQRRRLETGLRPFQSQVHVLACVVYLAMSCVPCPAPAPPATFPPPLPCRHSSSF